MYQNISKLLVYIAWYFLISCEFLVYHSNCVFSDCHEEIVLSAFYIFLISALKIKKWHIFYARIDGIGYLLSRLGLVVI